jgi:hypothetical protein
MVANRADDVSLVSAGATDAEDRAPILSEDRSVGA